MKQRIFLSPPHMGGRELELVNEAFASNYIAPVGPMMDAFEKAFSEICGIPHCVALSSGTAALHLALRELVQGSGVRGGQEAAACTGIDSDVHRERESGDVFGWHAGVHRL